MLLALGILFAPRLADAAARTGVGPEPFAVPEFKLGDTAQVDVITPIALIAMDPERTADARLREARKVPAVFRHYPLVNVQAETELLERVTALREQFLDAVERAFNRRKLNARAVGTPKFTRLMNNFHKQHRGFPFETNLASAWALQESDDAVVSVWTAQLRQSMDSYIRDDPLPGAARTGPPEIRMIFLSDSNSAVNLELVATNSVGVMRSNIVTLWKARRDLQNSFAPAEQVTAKFVASFIRPNCEFDGRLTHLSREERAAPIWRANRFKPGERVLRKGDVISPALMAALDELRAKTAAERIQAEATEEKRSAQAALAHLTTTATTALERADEIARRNRLLIGLSAGILALSLFIAWRLSRKGRVSLLPVRLGDGANVVEASVGDTIVVPLPGGETPLSIPENAAAGSATEPAASVNHDEAWKERALVAEQEATKARTVLRAGLVPHLAAWMMNKVVRGLFSQRNHLVEVQQKAEQDVAELEARLAEVHAPLKERLQAYERRIAELEKQLAAKGEENRELIKAKIQMARKRLEMERAKDPLTWN